MESGGGVAVNDQNGIVAAQSLLLHAVQVVREAFDYRIGRCLSEQSIRRIIFAISPKEHLTDRPIMALPITRA
jgi:hypothetical protein